MPDGSFLGLVGAHEDDVDRALAALAREAVWDERDTLPDEHALADWLRAVDSEPTEVRDEGRVEPARTASYSKPYLAHASIAPSCAMARWTTTARCTCGATARGIHAYGTRSPQRPDPGPPSVP